MPDPQRDRLVLPLSKDDLAKWRGDLDKSRAVRKTVQAWWDANLTKYAPSPKMDPDAYGSELNTNRDFTLVERKKADLFYQRPDVTAVASPLFEGHEGLLETHATILNEKLGLDGVHAKDLVQRALFDVLCPSGTGWTVMGYENISVPVETEQVVGEEPTPGSMLGLGATTPITQTITVPVPVFEDCFWRWISPRQGLIPHLFRSTIWDDAPWLGYDFEIPVRVAKAKHWVDERATGGSPSDDLFFDHGLGQSAGDAVVRGTIVFYKSALYRDDRPHPQHQTLLVLIEGQHQPAEHKDSPYQSLDARGALTPDSLIGFPIHPLTIRTLTDASYIPSDCTISRPIVNELNRFRGQMVEQRDANTLRFTYNTDVMPPDALAKIVRAPIGGMIGLPGEAFAGESIKELPHGTYPRENFSFHDYLDNDLARTHALDAEQAGADAGGDQTATEASIKQSNVNARLGLERGVVLDWYIRGVTKYSTLLQRFLPVAQAATIVGQAAAQEWDTWRKTIPASLAFTAMPNSTLRQDTAAEIDRRMKHYTYWANDPYVNRAELARETLKFLGYSAKVYQPTPPAKSPEPAKPAFSFKGDDLNPLNPQFPIVMEIMRQTGLQISPQAVQEAQAGAMNAALVQQAAAQDTGQGEPGQQTAHGGKIAQMESLDRHQAEQTGGMQGTGVANPLGRIQ